MFHHLNFGGGFVVRAAKLRVNSLVKSRVNRARDITKALRIEVGKVDKVCALKWAISSQVDVIAD